MARFNITIAPIEQVLSPHSNAVLQDDNVNTIFGINIAGSVLTGIVSSVIYAMCVFPRYIAFNPAHTSNTKYNIVKWVSAAASGIGAGFTVYEIAKVIEMYGFDVDYYGCNAKIHDALALQLSKNA